jgi:quercetin dioxygenase-like cupin family protein
LLEGTFKVTIGDQEFILQEGDSIYFDSTIPHSWENIGDTEVKFVSALTPPSL